MKYTMLQIGTLPRVVLLQKIRNVTERYHAQKKKKKRRNRIQLAQEEARGICENRNWTVHRATTAVAVSSMSRSRRPVRSRDRACRSIAALFFFSPDRPFDSGRGGLEEGAPSEEKTKGRRGACLVARLLQRDAHFPVDPFHSFGDPLPRGSPGSVGPSCCSPLLIQRAPRKPGGMVQTTRSAR